MANQLQLLYAHTHTHTLHAHKKPQCTNWKLRKNEFKERANKKWQTKKNKRWKSPILFCFRWFCFLFRGESNTHTKKFVRKVKWFVDATRLCNTVGGSERIVIVTRSGILYFIARSIWFENLFSLFAMAVRRLNTNMRISNVQMTQTSKLSFYQRNWNTRTCTRTNIQMHHRLEHLLNLRCFKCAIC